MYSSMYIYIYIYTVASATMATVSADVALTSDTLNATNQRTASQPRIVRPTYLTEQEQMQTLYLHYTRAAYNVRILDRKGR